MHHVIDRPSHPEAPRTAMGQATHDRQMARAALWVIEVMAKALAADPDLDRAALLQALVEAQGRRAGYEQADSLWPQAHEALQADMVALLAARLARG